MTRIFQQGGLYATEMNHSVGSCHCCGCSHWKVFGILRDVLAGRKPLILHAEVYAVWALIAGAIIGLDYAQAPFLFTWS